MISLLIAKRQNAIKINMKLIDSHAHIFSTLAGFGAEGELRCIGKGMARWATGRDERIIPEGFGDRTFTAEAYLSIMDKYNIEKAVLLQGGLLGFDNNYLRETVEKYPDRFIAAGAIDPYCRKEKEILDNLLKSFRIFKFESSTGCGLMGIHETFPLDGKMMMDIYSKIEKKNSIAVFDLGSPSDESHQIDAMISIAKRFPSMTVVICHLGSYKRNDRDILIAEMEKVKPFENIVFDASALMWKTRPEEYPFPIANDFLKIAKDRIGIERIMWGTDSPTMLCRYSMDQLIDCYCETLSSDEKDLFFYENAKRLYFSN